MKGSTWSATRTGVCCWRRCSIHTCRNYGTRSISTVAARTILSFDVNGIHITPNDDADATYGVSNVMNVFVPFELPVSLCDVTYPEARVDGPVLDKDRE